ncbi:hypothetical protein H7J77_03220 [Mycolicibacillus parakoreensis]|uniref:Uncharacterized protein n=1 Tax=Mycolicibacillus parakoreensis TaxID=1069221 RepID=A0ABY3U574_9MYCO|nr:hypothetical protein [Mycolicibacillus parakoreensis]MCV7314560.1 hypothetical protein [Mycolicibacillus parakoreensis]ULN53110.1 hypothetical protein MIU77_01700 [Mycolicibacillus parakoreensis]
MRRGVYFGVSAGVVLAGAVAVAAAPVTRPLPNVQVPVVELSSDSTPKIGEQYQQWWQIVSGDTAPPPSLNELTDLDLSGMLDHPAAAPSPSVTLTIDDALLPAPPA